MDTSLQLVFLNDSLRFTDSFMVANSCQSMYKGQQLVVVFVIVLNEQNKHKQQFDIIQAQQLQRKSGVPIFCVNDPKYTQTQMKKLISSQMFGNITINTQNLYYNNTVIDDICKKIPIHVYDIYDDNIDIPINQTHLIVRRYHDFLCSRQSYNFRDKGKIYASFRKRFALRDLFKDVTISKLKQHTSSSIQYNSLRTKTSSRKGGVVKYLGLVPVLELQLKANIPTYQVSEQQIWNQFMGIIHQYDQSRSKFGSLFDFENPTSSFMSPFISAGTLSTTEILYRCKEIKPKTKGVQMYIDEVLWNEFCHIYWLQNKDVLMQKGELMIGGLYGRKYKWKLNPVLLNHFEYGKLDRKYDLINAAMNQLRIQGYMSNYLRMIVTSFCLQQQIDWRECLRIFEKYLIDISWASNLFGHLFMANLVAGQPHVFSILRQTKLRDKNEEYRKKWLISS